MLRKKQITKKNKEGGQCIVKAKKIGKSNVGILEEKTQSEYSKQNQLLQHASKKKKNAGLKLQKAKNKRGVQESSTGTNATTQRHVNQDRPSFLKKTRSKNDSIEGNRKLGIALPRKSRNEESIYQVSIDSIDNVSKRLSDEENTILRTDTSVSSMTDIMENTKLISNDYPREADSSEYEEEIENANENKRSNENISKSNGKEVEKQESGDRKESKFNFLCMSIYVS